MATQVPSYDANGCPLCEQRKSGQCGRCGAHIPNFDNAEDQARLGLDIFRYKGMAGNGFQSVTWTHNHFKVIESKNGLQPILDELCLDCYRKDFKKAYPDAQAQI